MPTHEERIEYWADIIMGGWVRTQVKVGFGNFDNAAFASIRQGVIMGLTTPLPDASKWNESVDERLEELSSECEVKNDQ